MRVQQVDKQTRCSKRLFSQLARAKVVPVPVQAASNSLHQAPAVICPLIHLAKHHHLLISPHPNGSVKNSSIASVKIQVDRVEVLAVYQSCARANNLPFQLRPARTKGWRAVRPPFSQLLLP